MRHADGTETTVAACETVEIRGAADALRSRAHLLAGRDRTLLEMYLEHGNSLHQIGRLMGMSPANVGRRIRRIMRRLTDDTYAICVGNHHDFSGRELLLIKDHFVCGHSKRHISRTRGVTLYRVIATLQKASEYVASVKGRSA